MSLVNHLNLTISPFCNSDQIAIVPNTVVVVMWCFDGHIALVILSFLWQLFYTWANIILSLGCMLLMVECPKRSLWELRQNSLPAKELSYILLHVLSSVLRKHAVLWKFLVMLYWLYKLYTLTASKYSYYDKIEWSIDLEYLEASVLDSLQVRFATKPDAYSISICMCSPQGPV